ncbi:hypothetical protein GBAR_LOCUS25294 [Geodia barretti]|uniref:Uncharacterized protein n=1 Tax=Geodia barretti TaxID=519541 RepID=A0AA35X538_GEOBA|nr:hypothetical protein GBAR_LOCUS25294 [Geodia barretti]
MSCSVIAGLVLLLSATSVVGTGDANSTECVSQQELAAVKAVMERKVDQLHSQLHYWQSVNVDNIYRNYCSSSNDSVTEDRKNCGEDSAVIAVNSISPSDCQSHHSSRDPMCAHHQNEELRNKELQE